MAVISEAVIWCLIQNRVFYKSNSISKDTLLNYTYNSSPYKIWSVYYKHFTNKLKLREISNTITSSNWRH